MFPSLWFNFQVLRIIMCLFISKGALKGRGQERERRVKDEMRERVLYCFMAPNVFALNIAKIGVGQA